MTIKKKPQPLTLKELKVLEFIEDFMHGRSVAPTYQEIKEHFGFASFNSVQRYLKQLQDKNYIYIPGGNQKRALQVLHSSRSISNLLADRITDAPAFSTTQYPFPTQQKKGSPSPVGEVSTLSATSTGADSLSLPILGRVAAGLPIESFLHDEHIDVPPSLIRNPAKTFALIVQGQSMVEDGILDGDVIFVEKQTYANNGQTIVAMVNNQATVKRFYLHRKTDPDVHSNPQSLAQPSAPAPQVELRPANEAMKSMWYAPSVVDIQGVVVGLIRRL
jgi:repressor LexA